MKRRNSISKLSELTASVFGVEFVEAHPILAGGRTGNPDASGRNINLSDAPLPTFFLNLRPNYANAGEYQGWRFDYVLGDSDVGGEEESRYADGTLLYWAPVEDKELLSPGDAVIVRVRGTYVSGKTDNINEDWLCLRRIGKSDGKISPEGSEKIWMRSRMASSSDIKEELVDANEIVGLVFGCHNIKNHRQVIKSATLPFMKTPQYN